MYLGLLSLPFSALVCFWRQSVSLNLGLTTLSRLVDQRFKDHPVCIAPGLRLCTTALGIFFFLTQVPEI